MNKQLMDWVRRLDEAMMHQVCDGETRRPLSRETQERVADVAGCVLVAVVVVSAFWLYCHVTPNQLNAVNDLEGGRPNAVLPSNLGGES